MGKFKKPFLLMCFTTAFGLGLSPYTMGSALKQENKKKTLNKIYSLQIPFIENKGQIKDESVRYYAKTFGGTVFVTKDGKMVYFFPKFEEEKAVRGWLIQESFLGTSVSHVRGEEKAKTKVNYFRGKEPSKWRRNISTYNLVSLGEIYEGIELKLKAYGKNVEKLFYVKPGAYPESIEVRIEGAETLEVNEKGELEVATGLGVVKFTEPVAYQQENGKREYVEVAYAVRGDEYRFEVGDYDRTKGLVIDPLLGSRFHGGSEDDEAYAIFTSGEYVYVAGESYSDDLSVGAPGGPVGDDWSTNSGYNDAFVSWFSENLSVISSSTYLGGSGSDCATCLSVDSQGHVYVAGWTHYSTDFPTTFRAYDRNPGDCKAFITKFNNYLTDILDSTYLGGSNVEDYVQASSISIDNRGNVYVTGGALAQTFPTTSGAYDENWNGEEDAFLSKLDSGLQNLLASTYLGGSQKDRATCISLDSQGNVYVVGETESSNFPADTYDTGYNGGKDAFVSKLDGNLQNLLASTFLGGSHTERANAVVLDSSGDAYVAGETWSSNFPTSVNAYDRILNNQGELGEDAFVTKLNGDLQSLLASTFFGGSYGDWANSIALDSSGNVYVAGLTDALTHEMIPQCMSSDFPVTSGAYDTTFNNGGDCADAFVSKLDSGLQNLLASTYIGGDGEDKINSMFLDGSANVYVVGVTSSKDFPTTGGPDPTAGNEAFVSKLDQYLSDVAPMWPDAPSNLEAYQTPDRIHLTWHDNSDDETGFRVEYKLSLAGSWQELATVEADTTCHQTVYDFNQTYYFRVAAFNSHGDSDYSNEVSIYTARLVNWIRVDSPNGAEEWPVLSTQQISWSNASFPPAEINLYYATDTGCNWKTIDTNVPNTGSYEWHVPVDISNTCLVKIESVSGPVYDLSNEYFSITGITPWPGPGELLGDLTGDYKVDFYDLAVMAENWLMDISPFPVAQRVELEIAELNLSEEQLAQMQALSSQYIDNTAGFLEEIISMEEELRRLLEAETVDYSRAIELTQDIAQKETEWRQAGLTLDEEIRKLLTPEQREQVPPVPLMGGGFYEPIWLWPTDTSIHSLRCMWQCNSRYVSCFRQCVAIDELERVWCYRFCTQEYEICKRLCQGPE